MKISIIFTLALLLGANLFSQEITTVKVDGFCDLQKGKGLEHIQEIFQIDRFKITDTSFVHTQNEYRAEYEIKAGRLVDSKEIYLIESEELGRYKVRIDYGRGLLDVESRQDGAFIRLRYQFLKWSEQE